MTLDTEVKLGDVAEFVRGITFKPDDVVPLGTDASVACMRTKNVQDVLDCSDVWAVPAELVRRQDQMLGEGDILVSSANSWNLVGKCSWVPKLNWPASFGGFVSVLRATPQKVEPRFLYRWFSWDRTQAILRSFGQKTTNISNLNIERCLNMKLCLPPLPEQRRIAAILDQADALRAKRREALALLDELQRGIFIEMFGHVELKTQVWPTRALAELGRIVTGRTPPSSKAGMFGGDIPFFTPGDLESAEPIKRTVTEAGATEIEMVRAGATLVCCIGTVGKMGKTSQPSAFNQQINAIEWGVEVEEDFGFFMLGFFKKTLVSMAKSTTLPILNKSNFAKLEIPVPPMSMQRAFAKKFRAIQKIKLIYDESLTELDALFASLQQRLFREQL